MINIGATVTGESIDVMVATHAAGTAVTWTAGDNHTMYGMGDFSITFDRGIIEQDLIGVAGNYKEQGALSVNGSLTISKLDTDSNSDFLNSILDGTGENAYFSVSSNIGGATTSIVVVLVSCQVTGWDTTIGDADTITTASVDFIGVNPQSLTYAAGVISDA